MALTQLTKIDGGGISTTSDYRVGIITASKFVGPFDGSAGNFTGIITATGANFSGNVSIGGTLTYEDVTNIDSVGIITAQSDIHVGGGVSAVGVGTFGSLDIGGDIDVDGHTNLDNVSIAGVTTMGQTTISHTGAPQLIIKDSDTTGAADSNGISFRDASNTQYGFIGQTSSAGHTMLINTTNTVNPIRLQVNSSTKLEIGHTGVYVDNANFFVNGSYNSYLSGEVHIADSLIHQGDTDTKIRFPSNDTISFETAGTQRLNIASNGNISVTNDLDVDGHTNLDNINISGVTTSTGNISVMKSSGVANMSIVSADNYATLEIGGQSGAFIDLKSPASDDYDIRFVHDGYIYAKTNINLSPNAGYVVNVNKNLNCAENLDVDGHTNLDNVSVAGISTFSDNIRIADSKKLLLGNLAAGDCQFIHDGNDTFIQNKTGDLKIANNVAGDVGGDIIIQALNGEDSIKAIHDGAVQLYWDGGLRFSTDNQGALLPNEKGICFGDIGCKISGKNGSGSTNGLFFMTNSGGKWQMTGDGHFIPSAVGSYNIGSTGAEIGNVYLADSKHVYWGSDQDLAIVHNGTHGYIHAINGGLYIKVGNGEFLSRNGNDVIAKFLEGTGGVELWYNNSKKFDTVEKGIEVTGEVAATQDYPNLRPTLDLNFVSTKKIDPRFTYSRTGVASFIDENGLVKIVGDNVPRFDHDLDTGECKGLLIEETRTNILGNSDIATMSSPNLGGNPQVNDTVDDITLPTGEQGTVRRYLANAPGGGGRWGDYSGTNNTNYSGSVWVRTVSGTGSAVIDINDGGGKTVNLTTEWQRVSTTHSSNNTYRFFDIYFATPVTVYFWGVQIEQGSHPSSYIPTYGGYKTRGADLVRVDGEEFSEFYNPIESTILVDYTHDITSSQLGTDQRVYRFRAVGGSDTRIDYVSNSGYNPYISKDGVAVASISHGQSTVFGGGVNRSAVRVKENSFAVSFNGSTAVEDTSGAWNPTNTITELSLGSSDGGSSLNGHIRRFIYYSKGLPNSQLVTLTS